MKYQLSEQFRKKYKKQNIRIRKVIDNALEKFYRDHNDSSLNNHALKRELAGFHSIAIEDPKNDLRALYEEIQDENTIFAYFETFGTHKELFKSQNSKDN